MLLNNKGVFLYEAVISLLIVSVVFTHLMATSVRLTQARMEAKEAYEMQQLLVWHLLMLERDEPVPSTGDYQLILSEDTLCLSYLSVTNKNKEFCLHYE